MSPAAGVPPEVLRQVKLIELRTRGLVNTLFSGEYRSVFKGQGMEFAEVREYQPGDEVRTIDWNVTARMGRPFVKRFIEEVVPDKKTPIVPYCAGGTRSLLAGRRVRPLRGRGAEDGVEVDMKVIEVSEDRSYWSTRGCLASASTIGGTRNARVTR